MSSAGLSPPRALRTSKMQTEPDVDDRRLGERQLQHRAEQQESGLDREELLVAVDDPRGVGDGVLREQDVVERPGLHPRRQGVEVGRWCSPIIPPRPVQKMPKAMCTLNCPKTKIRSDQPSEPSGRFVVEQGDGLDAEGQDLQLERAGVLALARRR